MSWLIGGFVAVVAFWGWSILKVGSDADGALGYDDVPTAGPFCGRG